MPSQPQFSPEDRSLIEALFAAHGPDLDRELSRYVRDQHRREDLAQDVFVVVLRHWDRYDRQRPFWPWLRQVARNYLFAQARNRRWRSHISNLDDLESLAGPDANADDESPEAALIRAEDVRRIWDRVATLPEALRTPFELHYRDEKSCPEIAGILRIPVNTVYSRLHQARQFLKAM